MDPRLSLAIVRLEHGLARIERVAPGIASRAEGALSELAARHAALREASLAVVARLDRVIADQDAR